MGDVTTDREPGRRRDASPGAWARGRAFSAIASDAAPGLARNVAVLGTTAAFATTWLLAWSPVLALLLQRRGADATAIAATFAAVNLGTALAQYAGGRLADRVGARLVIGWTGIALGLTWFAMAATSGYWEALAFFYVVGNTLFGLQSTAFVTIIADSVTGEVRLQAFSRYQFWNSSALVVGPLLGGLWLLHASPEIYLGATGLAYLLVGVIRLAGLREPRDLPGAARTPISAERLVQTTVGDAGRRELVLLSAGVTLAFALTVQGPFMPVVAHALDRLPMRFVELCFGIGPFGALAASFLAPRLGGGRRAQGVGLALLAVAVAVMSSPLPPWLLVVAFLVAFAGYQVASVAYSAQRIALAGSTAVGEVLGATSAIAGIIAALGLLAAGAFGDRPALLLGALVAMATAGWHTRSGRRRPGTAAAGARDGRT